MAGIDLLFFFLTDDISSSLFIIGQSESPQCLCNARHESSFHFIVDCFLYSVERQLLFGQVEQYIPNFSKLCENKIYEILVFGLKRENLEYKQNNYNSSTKFHSQNLPVFSYLNSFPPSLSLYLSGTVLSTVVFILFFLYSMLLVVIIFVIIATLGSILDSQLS